MTAPMSYRGARHAVRRWHRPLVWFAVGSAVLSVVTAGAWLVDDRVLLGAPIWAKPLKFALSFTLYALTLAWMTSRLGRWRRAGWWAGTLLVAASVGELVIIVAQVLRGRGSHFNTATPIDAALFNAMGGLVAVIYLCTLVVAVGLLLTRLDDPALTWALRLGILVAVGGLSVGFVMVVHDGHAIGVPDGGPGLPLLGWSTTGGDLRVSHFIGMHALQLLPLLALLLRRTGLDRRTRVRTVWLAAGGYAGVTALTLWQALRGRPVLSLDAPPLAALAVLLGLLVVGGALVHRSRTHPSPAPPSPAATGSSAAVARTVEMSG